MADRVEITHEELALMLEALEDAAFYRDSRSHVLKSAAKRSARRSTLDAGGADPDVHRRKAQDYTALAVRLRRALR